VSALLAAIALLLHLLLVVALAPLVTGVVRRLAARFQGIHGPSPLQPWRDLLRGLARPAVLAESASWLAAAAPAGRLAALLLAAALVPSFTTATALAPLADLVLVAGLLALARALAALSWMDAGTATGGRMAAAAMARAVFAEPALLLLAYALALAAGGTNLAAIAAATGADAALIRPALLPIALALLAVVAADTATHGAPDAAGRPRALAEVGDALRLTVWLMLAAALLVPPAGAPAGTGPALVLGAWLLGLLAWLAKMAVLTALAALAATVLLRPAARHEPGWLGLAALAALLGLLVVFAGRGWA
jgi:formate hydrogenlyase subunit 4